MSKNTMRFILLIVTVAMTAFGLMVMDTTPSRCDRRCKEADPEWEAHVVWGTWSPCQCKDPNGNLKIP